MRERERVDPSLTRIRPGTRDLDPTISPISGHLTDRAWYRSEAWKPTVISQLFSSPETTRTPAIEFENSRPRPIFAAVDPAGLLAHHYSELVPQLSLVISRPVLSPETAGLPSISHWKAHGLGASINHRHRAWGLTGTTIGLTGV